MKRDPALTTSVSSQDADYIAPPCGVCGDPAEVIATVPMCGQRPRYPLCHECFEPINWNGYAEDVEVLP